MNLLRHLLHRHTTAARADAGDIVLCHRRSSTDATVRPAGHHHWIRVRNLTFDELAELLRAADSPCGDASVTASERLLFVANAIRMRRETAGAR